LSLFSLEVCFGQSFGFGCFDKSFGLVCFFSEFWFEFPLFGLLWSEVWSRFDRYLVWVFFICLQFRFGFALVKHLVCSGLDLIWL